MNKARAMLDALMGPNRDVVEKDKSKSEAKFKDRSVCKGFLLGFCPYDAACVGGKRKIEICEKIHSEPMRDQFNAHAEKDSLMEKYEELSLRDLQRVVQLCEDHIVKERARIRDDVRRKKPPLPAHINDKLAALKRESSAMIQRAETLDDDQFREKESLITKANEMIKDRDELLEEETKKAVATQPQEESCDICGTSYIGKDGDAAHLQFKIHHAYVKIRERLDELKPKVEARAREQREKKDEEAKKKRKEEWEAAQAKEQAKEKGKEKDKDDDEKDDKEKGKEKRKDKDDKEKGKEKDRSRDRNRSRDRSKDRDRGRDRRRSRSRSRDRDRDRGRGRAKSVEPGGSIAPA